MVPVMQKAQAMAQPTWELTQRVCRAGGASGATASPLRSGHSGM